MPPLPETIAYEQSEKKSGSEIWVNIGIVDEPERQLQKKAGIKSFNAELYDYRFSTEWKD